MNTTRDGIQARAHELLKTIIENKPEAVMSISGTGKTKDQALQESIARIETLYDAIIKTYKKND